jgi:hypothetical protein
MMLNQVKNEENKEKRPMPDTGGIMDHFANQSQSPENL